MDDAKQKFVERLEPFLKKGWDLHADSRQLRNDDLTSGDWIAEVEVWDNRGLDSLVQRHQEKERKTYGTEGEANAVALMVGLGWLERNA
jgi:hypothetical protein